MNSAPPRAAESGDGIRQDALGSDLSVGGLRVWLVLTAFLSGLGVMVLEMAAVRAEAPYFGQTNPIWTNVIGVILASLSVGYLVGGRLADRHPRPAVLYGVLLAGGILCGLLPFVVGPVSRWLLPADLSEEGATFLFHSASLAATLILFAPPVLLLAMVSPMAIKLLAEPGTVGNASGRIFAASTVGSIIGTFATTYYLIPRLGTRTTIVVASALLMGTAVVGLLLSLRRRTAAAAGVACVLLALLGAGDDRPIKEKPGQLAELESAYQYIRVLESTEQGPDRMTETAVFLQFNESESTYQSVRVVGSPLTNGRYYDYYATLPLLVRDEKQPALDVLVIGLAAGTIATELHHFFPERLSLTGVEIDREVVELGKKHFGLASDADWLDVVLADGRVYLNAGAGDRRFDLVIIDAFAQEYYIPFHLATREAFERARGLLKPGGILAMNVADRHDGPLLGAVEGTVASVFGGAWRVWIRGFKNFMVFAVNGGEPDFGPLRTLRHRAPPGRDWAALARIAGIVASGATRVLPPEDPDLVLTDDRAPVERLTDASARIESREMMGESP